MKGDVAYPAPLSHSLKYPEDLAVLQAVSGRGAPLITVFYSGRPVYANDLINLSDAFIAAFLPGSEAGGLADLILKPAAGAPRHDFTARLSFDWPGAACGSDLRDAGNVAFARGFGLTYAQPGSKRKLPEANVALACD